jgi:hypothetical protein
MTLIARLRSLGDDRAFILEFLVALARIKAMAERCPRRGEGAPKGPGCRRS